MGKKARKERHQQDAAAREAQEQREAEQARKRRRRILVLSLIPVVTAAAAYAVYQLAESKPLVGMVVLLGCASFIALVAASIGETIPPSGRSKPSGLNFGRR